VSDASGDFVPPIILRNKGVPITLYLLDETGSLVMTSDEPDAEPVTSTVHLRFTARMVADVEEMFDGIKATVAITEKRAVLDGAGNAIVGPAGPVVEDVVVGTEDRTFYGLQAFQQAMEIHPVGAMLKVMALALGTTPEIIDRRMLVEEFANYRNAVGVAWSIAQGVDPTVAARTLQQANAAVAATKERLASELEKMTAQAEAETTATPGSPG